MRFLAKTKLSGTFLLKLIWDQEKYYKSNKKRKQRWQQWAHSADDGLNRSSPRCSLNNNNNQNKRFSFWKRITDWTARLAPGLRWQRFKWRVFSMVNWQALYFYLILSTSRFFSFTFSTLKTTKTSTKRRRWEECNHGDAYGEASGHQTQLQEVLQQGRR